jgi:hypothetical protein
LKNHALDFTPDAMYALLEAWVSSNITPTSYADLMWTLMQSQNHSLRTFASLFDALKLLHRPCSTINKAMTAKTSKY